MSAMETDLSGSDVDNDEDLWEDVCLIFPIIEEEMKSEVQSHFSISPPFCIRALQGDHYDNVLEKISKNEQLTSEIEDLVFDKIQKKLSRSVFPLFWSNFDKPTNTPEEGYEKFRYATLNMYKSTIVYFEPLCRLRQLREFSNKKGKYEYEENALKGSFKLMLRSTFRSELPLNFLKITEDFYGISFRAFCHAERSKLDKDTEDGCSSQGVQCRGCEKELAKCHCKVILEMYHSTNRILMDLGIFECISAEAMTKLVNTKIKNYITDSCKGTYDVSRIKSLENWLEVIVMGWLISTYRGDPEDELIVPEETIEKFRKRVTVFMYDTYTRTRIEELFDIIIDYPDSKPAVEDLRICLDKIDIRRSLTDDLKEAVVKRLLHTGVKTSDILTAYVAAIRALRLLDPTGVILESVTLPVKGYLKNRGDTIRCVARSITEEGFSELADEFVKGREVIVDENSDDDNMENWEQWTPPPRHADPKKSSRSRKADIISMLINSFGSKELFVNEYCTLLANRLLTHFDNNTEKEIRYLELLKLRFGDNLLHNCEVMLKDVSNSKRISNLLHSEPIYNLSSMSFDCSALILSAQFWPALSEETFVVPEFISKNLEIYTKGFEVLKRNRTLEWKLNFGSVNVDIELKDRVINLNVTPMVATILYHFQEKGKRTVDELNEITQIPPSILKTKITFLQKQGIVKEISPDVYEVVEENSESSPETDCEEVEEEEGTSGAVQSTDAKKEEELEVCWSYIVGMLTNLDSLTLEAIRQLLKTFAPHCQTAAQCTSQDLLILLEKKIRENKLLVNRGLYTLRK